VKIIIIGAGRVGESVADSLVSEHNDITVIDTTDRKFNRMRPSMARVLGLETRSAKEG